MWMYFINIFRSVKVSAMKSGLSPSCKENKYNNIKLSQSIQVVRNERALQSNV